MWVLIPILAILIGGAIPITAIVTIHKRAQTKLQIELADRELQLEQLKLQNFDKETEKMRIELEYMKQQRLELPNTLTNQLDS